MRLARLIAPGAFHHIRSRFVDRNWEFTQSIEREKYLHYLGLALEKSDWRCISYALMSNHIHHGWIAGETPFGALFKAVHSPFARWMNARRERLGPLFADRPLVSITRPENVARTITYIHNNPLRAGVVGCAAESSWTSHQAYLGLVPAPKWLHVDEGLRLLAMTPTEFDETARASNDTRETLATIAKAAHKRGAVEVATPVVDPIDAPLVCRPFARVRPDPRDVVFAVAEQVGLPASQFSSRIVSPACVRARAIAVRAAVSLGISLADIAAALGITRQSTSQLAQRPLDREAYDVVALVQTQLTLFTPSRLNARKHTG